MTKPSWKFTTGKLDKSLITVHTDLGYDVTFRLKPIIMVDIENKEKKNLPFFYITFDPQYIDTKKKKESISLLDIQKNLKNSNILPPHIDFDYLHVGFIYDENNPDNHRWMVNLFKNKEFVYNFISDQVKIRCQFETVSWQDGIWHGRFLINRKDIKSITEKNPGTLELIGKRHNKVKTHIHEANLPDKTYLLSLRFSIKENIWYCDFKDENKNIIQTTPSKNITCSAPILGEVDWANPRPKVTANIYAKKVESIEVGLNNLNIKGK